MDNKQAIEELKKIKQNHIDLNYRFRHLYDDYIVAIDKAIAYIEIWDKFYNDIEQLKEEQAENLKGFNGTYRDGYRDALDVILLSMETRKEGIEKCKEKNVKGL